MEVIIVQEKAVTRMSEMVIKIDGVVDELKTSDELE